MLVRYLAPLLWLAVPAAAGDVLTVASDGSGDYSDVISAVAAAQDGDIVLIGPGGYVAPTLVDRDLALVARDGPLPVLAGRLRITDQKAGKTLLVSGLFLRATANDRPALRVERCRGAVRVDAAIVEGETRHFCPGGVAVSASRSRDVALLRTTCTGGDSGLDDGTCDPNRGGDALDARRSTVAAWRSLFTGGEGNSSVLPDIPTHGGAGARLIESSVLYAFYDLFQGGPGGSDLFGDPYCGEGGDGIHSTASNAWDQDSILLGGQGGTGGAKTCNDGQPFAGTGHHDVAGTPRALEGPRVVTTGQPMTLDLYALPGELASLAVSQETRFAFDPAAEGARLVGRLDLPLIPLARIDGDGHVAVTVDAPPLAAGEEGRVLYLQLVVQDALSGTTRWGSPISVVVLQPGI